MKSYCSIFNGLCLFVPLQLAENIPVQLQIYKRLVIVCTANTRQTDSATRWRRCWKIKIQPPPSIFHLFSISKGVHSDPAMYNFRRMGQLFICKFPHVRYTISDINQGTAYQSRPVSSQFYRHVRRAIEVGEAFCVWKIEFSPAEKLFNLLHLFYLMFHSCLPCCISSKSFLLVRRFLCEQ
jgi:hypothetical protein